MFNFDPKNLHKLSFDLNLVGFKLNEKTIQCLQSFLFIFISERIFGCSLSNN